MKPATKMHWLGQMRDANYQPVRMYRGRRAGSTIAKFLIVFDGEQRILAVINADGYIADDTPIISLVMLPNIDRNIALVDIQTGWGFDYEIFWQGYGSQVFEFSNSKSFLAP